MGFIRSILLIGVSILLFLSLFIGNIFLTLSWSLEYETVKPQMITLVEDLANNELGLFESVNKDFYLMTTYCQNNSEYVFAQEGYTFVIPCENILLGPEEVIKYGIANLVTQMYYEEYDCNFWECVKLADKPFVLVSEKAKDYWKSKFYLILMITIGLIILSVLILGIGLKFINIGFKLTNFFSKIQEIDSTSLKKEDSEIPKVENMTKEEITKMIKEEVNNTKTKKSKKTK